LPGYSRVAGTNAIGSDTQEDGITLLPRAITFSAGTGSAGLVIQTRMDLDLTLYARHHHRPDGRERWREPDH
jgi:hypothetical protein